MAGRGFKTLTMKIAYIAHPVGGDVTGNLEKIRAIVRKINLEEPRVVPFVPYYADCVAMDDSVPAERARGFKNNYAFFRKGMVDELRIYGEHISPGMKKEIEWAHMNRIPVVNYITAETTGNK